MGEPCRRNAGSQALGVILLCFLTQTTSFAQTGPLMGGQSWQGGVGPDGSILRINTDGDPEPETYPIIPEVLANNSGDVEFLLSPNGSVVYARAFGSALSASCSPGGNQIYFFRPVQDTDATGHLETIFNGGLCINGPPDHEGLYEVFGQGQHMAYAVEPVGTSAPTRQNVHWVNLNGFNDSGRTVLNVDVDGVFFEFTPDGFAALVKHGVATQPGDADYTLVDLCPSPRLGNSLTSDVGGVLFNLPNPEPSASVEEEPAGSGQLVVRIVHTDIGTTGQLDVALAPCSGTSTGACCDGGECSVTTDGGCAGDYQGNGSTCPHPSCAPTTGACCITGICSITSSGACAGSYQGDGAACPHPACEPKADLAITKSDSIDPVIAGLAMSYTLEVMNNGPNEATDVVVCDTLPPGVTFDAGTSSAGCDDFGNIVECTMPSLLNGASTSFDIGVTVDPTTRGLITNTATVEATQTDPNDTNDSAVEQTMVNASADLEVSKSDHPDPVAPSGTLIFEVTVDNLGPSTATRVTITDTLPVDVRPLDWKGNPDIQEILECDGELIDPGASRTFTLVTQVDPEVIVGRILTNVVEAVAEEPDPNPNNNSAVTTTTVGPLPAPGNRRFTLIADSDTAIPSGSGNFTVLEAPVVSEVAVGFSAAGTGQEGVYRWVNGVLVSVADTESPIPGGTGTFRNLWNIGDTPSIDGLAVAFRGVGPGPSPSPFRVFQEGLYYIDECGLRLVVDQRTPNPSDPPFAFDAFFNPRLRDGQIAFYGFGIVPDGVYVWDGGGVVTIADGDTAIPEGVGNFTEVQEPVFDGSTVVFWAGGGGHVNGHRERPGIYAFTAGGPIRVADNTTPVPGDGNPFKGFGQRPAVDGDVIAFTGVNDSVQGLYVYNISDQTLEVVADTQTIAPGTTTNFWSFLEISVSGGRVAFMGQSTPAGPRDFFVAELGVVRPVFVGTPNLDGRVVFGADFTQEGFRGTKFGLLGNYLASSMPIVIGYAIYLFNVPLAGDYDGDGEIGGSDYARFTDCLEGPAQPPSPDFPLTEVECLMAFDSELDNDIDLFDFRMLQLTARRD